MEVNTNIDQPTRDYKLDSILKPGELTTRLPSRLHLEGIKRLSLEITPEQPGSTLAKATKIIHGCFDLSYCFLFGDFWKEVIMLISRIFSWFRSEPASPKPLSPQQIKLVRQSWSEVENQKQECGVQMFMRLFEIAPYLRDLFPFGYDPSGPGLRAHALGVMETVEVAVNGLDDLDNLSPKLVELGKQHKQFDLTEKEFTHVGDALLWTLEKGLADKFTPDTKAAWVEAYGIIKGAMKEGLK